jgi:hypothetical protein
VALGEAVCLPAAGDSARGATGAKRIPEPEKSLREYYQSALEARVFLYRIDFVRSEGVDAKDQNTL